MALEDVALTSMDAMFSPPCKNLFHSCFGVVLCLSRILRFNLYILFWQILSGDSVCRCKQPFANNTVAFNLAACFVSVHFSQNCLIVESWTWLGNHQAVMQACNEGQSSIQEYGVQEQFKNSYTAVGKQLKWWNLKTENWWNLKTDENWKKKKKGKKNHTWVAEYATL